MLKMKGSNRIIYLSKNRAPKNINRHLLGRLSKVGETRVLAVRVINSESGDVIFDKSVVYSDERAFDDGLESIINEINNKKIIWE